MEVKEKVWTYEDYMKLNDDKRYEVINGRLYEMPAPTVFHQKTLRNIFTSIWLFVRKHLLGEVLPSPIDVILSDFIAVQPDLVFISKDRREIVKDRIYGAPDLVVEIVSPTSYYRDRYEKFRIYEEAGIKEYWLVYPGEKVIEVWVLKEGKYELYSIASNEGKVKSKVLEGFEVDLKEVFDES